MSDGLSQGTTATLERVVHERDCTRRGAYDIFSTPNVVLLLEEAAIEALAPHLGAGQGSVGSRVDIAHTAPTLKGQRVRATATVEQVDRRRVVFTITVEDDTETVATGRHERFIVDLDSFGSRLEQKLAAVASSSSTDAPEGS